jgi:hypothetical protein
VGQFDRQLLPLLDRFHTPSGDLIVSEAALVQVGAIDRVEAKLELGGSGSGDPVLMQGGQQRGAVVPAAGAGGASDAFLLPLVALFWGGVVAIIDDPLAPQVVLSAANESVARDAI